MGDRSVRNVFDANYFKRFYREVGTRSVTPAEVRRQIDFLCAYLKYLRLPIRRILDLGCGPGLMRKPLATHYPRASYSGVDVSEYMCRRYGWTQASVTEYRSRWPFDLVICHDVIQYLDDAQTQHAIDNLAQLCRGVLYLGVITREDWDNNCDHQRTDDQVHLRTQSWYRQRLTPHFSNIGGGLWVQHKAPVVLWSLERAEL